MKAKQISQRRKHRQVRRSTPLAGVHANLRSSYPPGKIQASVFTCVSNTPCEWFGFPREGRLMYPLPRIHVWEKPLPRGVLKGIAKRIKSNVQLIR